MKHIIAVVVFCSAFLWIGCSSVQAQGSSFNDVDVGIRYCQNGECGLNKGIEEVGNALEGTGVVVDRSTDLVTYVQKILAENVLVYLYFLMVVIIIYAGFLILTAAGDEDKVSKGKKIILYAVIGVVIIFLAGPLTEFIFDMFD